MEENKRDYKREYIVLVVVVILVVLDQITKIAAIHHNETFLIPNILKITIVQNRSGAFGVGGENIFLFIITNIIVLGMIIRFILTQKQNIDHKTIVSLTLVLSGGFSNLMDRLIRGYVVDYLDISQIIPFPKFNLADSYIVIGWILFALFFAIYSSRELKQIRQKRPLA